MIPERFVTEYPARCLDLLHLLEPAARERELMGSFSLLVASSVFLIPYERMKTRHPLNRGGRGGKLYSSIVRIEKQRFLEAEIWKDGPVEGWRLSRIMNSVENTSDWQDDANHHPMSPKANNSIASKKLGEVLRVIRNALAHGNVVYLNDSGYETKGTKLRYMAFLSRYEETKEQCEASETYRILVTTEEGFLIFVKSWATWLAGLPADTRFSQAAE